MANKQAQTQQVIDILRTQGGYATLGQLYHLADTTSWATKTPNSFFEVEHSTEIQNSITKFCDLQDFHSRFIIVASINRRSLFEKIMNRTAFKEMKEHVKFSSYETILKQYELMCIEKSHRDSI